MQKIMKRVIQRWALVLLFLELASCSALKLFPSEKAPAPVQQAAHIGISLSAHTLIFIFDRPLTTLYFARLEEDQNDFISKWPLIPSTAKVGNRFYLLNALPGRYIAVAARGVNVQTGSHYNIAFSKPLIALTEVKVDPERMAFMGRFRVKTQSSLLNRHPDEVQRDVFGRTGAIPDLGSVQDVEQGTKSEQEFLAKAKDDLGETEWGSIIQQSLVLLQKSEADHEASQPSKP